MNLKDKRPSFVVNEAATSLEAVGYMASGLWYFLEHHFIKTAAALLIMCGSSLAVVGMSYLYLKSDSITINRAEPVKGKALSFNGTMMPLAVAGGPAKGDSIIINGELYGFADPHYNVWKLMGEAAILIHDKHHGDVLKAEAPVFSEQTIEQYKK